MEKLTQQQAFNIVWNGLKAQGWKKSLSPDGHRCRYRGAEGRKCALGHLIPDDLYFRDMDLYNMDSTVVMRVIGQDQLIGMAPKLQIAHDNPGAIGIIEALKSVAASYNLTVPDA